MKTKIRRDKHSLYVRTNGAIYRPVLTPYSETVMQPEYRKQWEAVEVLKRYEPYHGARADRALDRTYAYTPDPHLFGNFINETVRVHAVSQASYCKVTSPDGREAYWFSHGSYIDHNGKTLPSDGIWQG